MKYFIIILTIHLFLNYYLIKVRQVKSVLHGLQAIIRSIIWAACSVYLYPSWPDVFYCFVALHLAFWFPFDLFLNILIGQRWDYIGKTSKLDILGRQWPGAFIPMKFLLFIMGVAFLTFGPQ
jgi:hypothetical protein